MCLLKFSGHGDLSLTKDLVEDIPSYAILSHTWGADDDAAESHLRQREGVRGP
jgi:hypothetical protein